MVTCDCGKRYEQLSEIENIRSVGLVLQAPCPNCGARLTINSLWRATVRTTLGECRKLGFEAALERGRTERNCTSKTAVSTGYVGQKTGD